MEKLVRQQTAHRNHPCVPGADQRGGLGKSITPVQAGDTYYTAAAKPEPNLVVGCPFCSLGILEWEAVKCYSCTALIPAAFWEPNYRGSLPRVIIEDWADDNFGPPIPIGQWDDLDDLANLMLCCDRLADDCDCKLPISFVQLNMFAREHTVYEPEGGCNSCRYYNKASCIPLREATAVYEIAEALSPLISRCQQFRAADTMSIGDIDILADANLCCDNLPSDCRCHLPIYSEAIDQALRAHDLYAVDTACEQCWHYEEATCVPLRNAVHTLVDDPSAISAIPLIGPCPQYRDAAEFSRNFDLFDRE